MYLLCIIYFGIWVRVKEKWEWGRELREIRRGFRGEDRGFERVWGFGNNNDYLFEKRI